MDAVVAECARLYAPGDVRVSQEQVPEPGPGEVLLRVTAVGLCGSDLHWFAEGSIGDAALSRPLILGHEIAAGPRTGERVAVDPAANCGRCEPCLADRPNLCLAMRFAGHGSTDGGLRTYMTWPERLLTAVPDGISDDAAPLLEPLGVALHALDLAEMPSGVSAGVYGCGPLGLLIVAALRGAGASEIVATDLLAHRVAAARAMGADEAILVERDGSAASPGRAEARRRSVDLAFEVSGSDEALSDAIAAVRPGGRVVLVGIPPRDRHTFEAAAARRKELALLECRRMLPSDLPRAAELAADGSIDLAGLVSDRFPLSAAGQAFAALAERRGLKTIVRPAGASANQTPASAEETR